MLSKETMEFLNSACRRSAQLWDQGGLIYLYKYGYHRAHSFIPNDILKDSHDRLPLDEKEKELILKLFGAAFCEFETESTSISSDTMIWVSDFISLLSKDLDGMHSLVYEYDNDCCSIDLTLLFVENNDFHSLKLFWSMD